VPRRRESELRRSEPGTARFTIEWLERRGNAARVERTKLRGCFRHGAVEARNKLRFTGYLLGRVLTSGRYKLVRDGQRPHGGALAREAHRLPNPQVNPVAAQASATLR